MHADRPGLWLAPAMFAGATTLSLMAGVAVQRGYGAQLALGAIGMGALTAAGRWRRGLIIGLVVLSTLDGFPFVEMNDLAARFNLGDSDLFVPVLIVALIAWNLEEGATDRSPRLRALAWKWSAALTSWWVLVWLWSVADGIPPLNAALYGRDFLWFALLLPLLIGALRDRDDLLALSVTLGVGALVYAVAQHLAEFAGLDPSNFIHAALVGGTEAGFTRYFAPMAHLQVGGLCFGAGLVLLSRDPRGRAVGWILVFVVGTGVALQFTRATYAGVVLGLVITTAAWATHGGETGRRLRRVAVTGAAVLATAAVAFALSGASLSRESAPGAVANRTTSGLTDVRQGTGTFGARRNIYDRMLDTLGTRWPIGLGFIDPEVRLVGEVGRIRSPDVGLLNAVMTMGVIGLLLLLAAPVAIVVLAARSAGAPGRWHWVAFGASLFLLEALISAPTLVTLFGVPGLVLSAVVCGAACRVFEPTVATDTA